MKLIRILLAEDQTLMRQGLKTLLELEPGHRVIGEAENGQAAVKLALQLRPDIILMDVQMPLQNGVEATAAICRSWPEARIIILTTFDRDDYVFQGVRAGAMGYLLKDLPAHKLFETIRCVHAGEPFIQPEIASRTLRASLHPTGDLVEPLSEREREVLVMLAQGVPNKEIADKLHIAEGTVKNHVSNILGKLQVQNRTQAANFARRRGLV
ncbi:MAG TPA: response regulator transcription factor [Candidatus Sulfotelmatobacter sp.]|nr:response regulator transcription factor [Candidatus Sulfotelmatobacter sp.]HWI59664.1 response regulator transcription factor [Bacillota bacterium]